jgi:hypothetical protein
MGGLTRGRLPARVYWVRRIIVLAIATLLVVGIAKLLGGSSDGSGPDMAAHVADTAPPARGTTSSDPATSPAAGAPSTVRRHHHAKAGASTTPLALPSGPCAASDVVITPSVPKPVAGRDISLVLDISTATTPACTWTLSPRTMALKITSGSDLIWTTAECGHAIPKEDLVLRQSTPTRVTLKWDARRSEPGCPVRTEWALPGTYHLHVAALAGQPQDVAFLLTAPTPAQVTKTAHPHQNHHKTKHHSRG